MQTAAIYRQAEVTREHTDAVINIFLLALDAKDGRYSADMSQQEIADVLVKHESQTVLAMIGAASPEWADALANAQGKYIRIN